MTSSLRTPLAVLSVTSLLLDCGVQDRENVSPADLLREFETTTVAWRQLAVARQLAIRGDRGVLEDLEPWLEHSDRHLRLNAAFVFASLGDRRGMETIRTVLTDRSNRPLGQGIPGGSFNMARPGWWLAAQIRADRYYAVHMSGLLRNPEAVDRLISLLGDEDINYHVAWAPEEIGDRRAVRPLIAALASRLPLMRVSAIAALETLAATEALPALRTLLNDLALPGAGPRIPVGERAKSAIAAIERGR